MRPLSLVAVAVIYGRSKLIGLPYVVKMYRKILAVLYRNKLLLHITKTSRQTRQMRQRGCTLGLRTVDSETINEKSLKSAAHCLAKSKLYNCVQFAAVLVLDVRISEINLLMSGGISFTLTSLISLRYLHCALSKLRRSVL